MKIGIIGTGWMGKNHIRIYNDLRGVEEIFIVDINNSAARQVANQFSVQVAGSIDELLQKVNLASVCVPTASHHEVVKKVLNAGVHCLIEKPVASTVQEARKVADAVAKSKVIVGVGHIERFNPVIQETKRILEKPYYIELERHNPHFGRITDADVITDLMIHDIDILWNYLFKGKKYKIVGAGGVKKEMLELVSAIIDFEGCIVKLSGSRLSSKKTRQISVEEEQKTTVGDLMTQELYVHKKAKPLDSPTINYSQESVVDKVLLSKVEPLREELKMFLECVRSGKEFPVSVNDGVSALRVADEIRARVEAK
ncbi:Gfo/Idh/MocA family oxidoreductase [Candidatus Micrarchaeota archaeon]|nr:Gfo/Idh/MocA family oxidoreductase [Candidatus Micrarchaeota archaeon]